MTGTIRVLDEADKPELMQFLARDPVTNLFVASRVNAHGVAPGYMASTIFGYHVAGELAACCLMGGNLVPIGDAPGSMQAFVEAIGSRSVVGSIMGEAPLVQRLYAGLTERWGSTWSRPRDVRPHQPLMVIDRDPDVPGDPRVQRMTMSYYEAYVSAAVAMYTEEVGVTPLDGSTSYERYVKILIETGRAMGAVHVPENQPGRVWFKSDIGAAWRDHCQVQGVWLDPALRGRRMSVPAMAQAVRLCRERFPVVSLYVNDYNTRARALYQALGFQTVGELATILY